MTEPFLRRDASLGYQINNLARLLERALRQRIQPLGVVPGQFAQLLALYEEDGLTQAELCKRVQIEQPTMANTLARMQRAGLIEHVPDQADARRSFIHLTPRARSLEAALTSAASEVNAMAIAGVGRDQATEFVATLTKMIHNLK
jgi:DNA-binding MarR family transcriptional regulator